MITGAMTYKNEPLVSICIPTHNRPQLLREAIKSARNQTYKNIEIIISDNSTDSRSKQLVSHIKDRRIRYFKNGATTSSFNNINNIVYRAHGNFIKYLLDDDLLDSECVMKMVNILIKYPTVGVVMAPLKIIDINGSPIQPRFYFFKKMKYLYKYLNISKYINKEIIMEDFLTRTYPCCVPTGIMFRRSLFEKVGGFDKKFNYIGDVDLCMSFASLMDFYYINEFLSSWRYTETSDTISILHKRGIESDIFYNLIQKYIAYAKNRRATYFFASKRSTLNIIAGIQSRNLSLIFETLKTILYNDTYILNKIVLPINLLFEVMKSILYIYE